MQECSWDHPFDFGCGMQLHNGAQDFMDLLHHFDAHILVWFYRLLQLVQHVFVALVSTPTSTHFKIARTSLAVEPRKGIWNVAAISPTVLAAKVVYCRRLSRWVEGFMLVRFQVPIARPMRVCLILALRNWSCQPHVGSSNDKDWPRCNAFWHSFA
jgi:hypothetical protein